MEDIICITSSLEAVPHATTKDDVYAGFFIPKGEPRFLKEFALCFLTCFSGAVVIGNAWWAMIYLLFRSTLNAFQGDVTRPCLIS